jgi:hypothetical protein
MLEISMNPWSNDNCYVIYIHLNLSDLGDRQIKDIIPSYVPNIWSFEYTTDQKQSKVKSTDHVLYMPLITQLKENYLQNDKIMRRKMSSLVSDNIDHILKNPSNNVMDQFNKEIAELIGKEIISNLRSTRLQQRNITCDHKNILIAIMVFIAIFSLLSIRITA